MSRSPEEGIQFKNSYESVLPIQVHFGHPFNFIYVRSETVLFVPRGTTGNPLYTIPFCIIPLFPTKRIRVDRCKLFLFPHFAISSRFTGTRYLLALMGGWEEAPPTFAGKTVRLVAVVAVGYGEV
jgi:hypothetical protein